jgi:hypothetical protein
MNLKTTIKGDTTVKNITLFVLMVLFGQFSFSQSKLNVYMNNNTTQTFELSQIDSITFSTETTPPPPGGDEQWLTHDDGAYEGSFTTEDKYYYFMVRFDKPSGWTNFKATKVRVTCSVDATSDSINLVGYNTQYNSTSKIYMPYQRIAGPTATLDPKSGLNEWTVDWPLNIDRFCIGYFQTGSTSPDPNFDTNSPLDTSSFAIYMQSSSLYASAIVDVKLAIQVYVVQTTTAGKSMIGEPSGIWLNGVASNNTLLKNGVHQAAPSVINSETVTVKKLQNNAK